jgi:hypothetical protein
MRAKAHRGRRSTVAGFGQHETAVAVIPVGQGAQRIGRGGAPRRRAAPSGDGVAIKPPELAGNGEALGGGRGSRRPARWWLGVSPVFGGGRQLE